MRRLIVMRHAKAVSEVDARGDHARSLADRGRTDAQLVGRRLVALGWSPDRVLSSDAARTRETWDRLSEVLTQPLVPTFTRQLYLAGPAEVVDALFEVDEGARTLLLLGHNPGWEQLVAGLSGQGVEMPTACAALLELEGERPWWQAASTGGWRLVELIRPKTLR
ncbi:MAG: histidine phosphatase family protein [Alphaproteobacteria bacterium]|nr:histidine phosphatase family protein [Alphaproteobacteria bacterium]